MKSSVEKLLPSGYAPSPAPRLSEASPAAASPAIVQARFGHSLTHARPVRTFSLQRTPIQRAVDLNAPPWDELQKAGIRSLGGGNEGAYLLPFPGGNLVFKPAYDPASVLFAHEMARRSGLPAPAARAATSGEIETLAKASRALFTIPTPGYVLMDYVEGIDLESLATAAPLDFDSDEWESLAEQLGHWLAFDLVIGEIDRFSGLTGARPGLKAGNLMVGQGLSLHGIDNAAMGLGVRPMNLELVAMIRNEDETLVQRLVKALAAALRVTDDMDVDLDDVARDVLRSARRLLRAFKRDGAGVAAAAGAASGASEIAQQVQKNIGAL